MANPFESFINNLLLMTGFIKKIRNKCNFICTTHWMHTTYNRFVTWKIDCITIFHFCFPVTSWNYINLNWKSGALYGCVLCDLPTCHSFDYTILLLAECKLVLNAWCVLCEKKIAKPYFRTIFSQLSYYRQVFKSLLW